MEIMVTRYLYIYWYFEFLSVIWDRLFHNHLTEYLKKFIDVGGNKLDDTIRAEKFTMTFHG